MKSEHLTDPIYTLCHPREKKKKENYEFVLSELFLKGPCSNFSVFLTSSFRMLTTIWSISSIAFWMFVLGVQSALTALWGLASSFFLICKYITWQSCGYLAFVFEDSFREVIWVL